MTRVHLAGTTIIACCFLGCWAGGSAIRPGIDASAPPSPTLLVSAIDCTQGTSGEDAGKEVVSRTSYGAALIDSIDAHLRGVGPVLPAFEGRVCDGFFAPEARDDEDWSAPRPPPAIRELLRKYGAQSVLITAVENGWQCLSEGPATTSCRENRLEMVAYLFTADAVIWKSAWQLNIAHETPDVGSGVMKLLTGVPIARITRLQDDEAPTYERALEQAGVAP